ncbi:MAG: outer membrane lipoprotein-sorting protein [Deltaproteobacteria bacterium]|nr:outer membrane lipoprotein-sorting protein [Deltaproteobacteria bacterium]
MDWQLRPVYVVELTPKLTKYPYSKQILWIDAESFVAHFKQAYDRKGQLWKLMVNATNDSVDPASKPLTIATAFLVDLQEEHATVFPWHSNEANVGVDPDIFSLATLRKKAK